MQRHCVLPLLAALVTTGCSLAPSPYVSPLPRIEQQRLRHLNDHPAFVGIQRVDPQHHAPSATASGFVVRYRNRWFLLSSAHFAAPTVRNENLHLHVIFNGTARHYYPIGGTWIAHINEHHDIVALPWYPPKAIREHPLTLHDTTDLVAGHTPVVAACSALRPMLRIGRYAGKAHPFLKRIGGSLIIAFHQQPGVIPGCSGGAMIDGAHHVHGLITNKHPDTETGYATPADAIMRFLDTAYFISLE